MSDSKDFIVENGVLKEYVGSGGDVVIPDGVKEIGARAFSKCHNLMSVTIPESVESIGEYAFSECNNLSRVTIPESVKTVGFWAFYNCESLTDVVIKGTDTFIDNYAFAYCFNLKNADLPDSVSLGTGVFAKCPKMADAEGFVIIHGILQHYAGPGGDIQIPDEVVQIGYGAFDTCRDLRSVIIPDSVKSIESNAFESCENLTSVTIPDSVSSIGSDAFHGCGKVEFIAGDAVKTLIHQYDFTIEGSILKKYNGPGGDVIIPMGVTEIDHGAFWLCGGITSVTIPESTNEICGSSGRQTGAFAYLNDLKSIRILGAQTVIGAGALYKCPDVEEVYAPALPFRVLKDAGLQKQAVMAFIRHAQDYTDAAVRSEYLACLAAQKKKLLPAILSADAAEILEELADAGKISKKELEQGYYQPALQQKAERCVEFLEKLASEWGLSLAEPSKRSRTAKQIPNRKEDFVIKDGVLTKYLGSGGDIILPEGITRIDNRLFFGNTGLTGVVIPEGVTIIGSESFAVCTGLRSVSLPQSLTDIWWGAFRDCTSLESITIPKGVSKIDWRVFENCTGLTRIDVQNKEARFDHTAFDGCTGLADPTGFVILNGTLFGYCGTGGDVVIPEGVSRIASYAFHKCDKLTSVVIPEGVTEIGEKAFSDCKQLSVSLPDSLKKVKSAFSGCVCSVRAKRWLQAFNRLLADCALAEVDAEDYSAFPAEDLLSRAIRLSKTDSWDPAGKNETAMLAGLKKNAGKLRAAAAIDAEKLGFLCDNRLISAKDYDSFLSEAEKNGDTAAKALLLDYQNKMGADTVAKARAKKEKVKEEYEDALVERIAARDPSKGIEGMTFVITGALNTWPEVWSSRKEVKEYLSHYGAILGSSLSKKTDYLVTNDTESGSEKNRKAEELGVRVITEEEFNHMIGRRFIDAETVTVPSWLKTVAPFAFSFPGWSIWRKSHWYKKLREAILPESIESIGEMAFAGAENLEKINLPEKLTYIGRDAFIGCTNLRSIRIPAGLRSIAHGAGAFSFCDNLRDVYFPSEMEDVTVIWAFDVCPNCVIHAPAGSPVEQYAIENNIRFEAE